MLANRVREGYRWMISKISNLGGIVKTKAMDTADPRDRQTGGGLSTEKQNITSTALVCVCVCVCGHVCVEDKATNLANTSFAKRTVWFVTKVRKPPKNSSLGEATLLYILLHHVCCIYWWAYVRNFTLYICQMIIEQLN